MAFISARPTTRQLLGRRVLFFGLSVITILLVSLRAWQMIRPNGVTLLEGCSFVLFLILMIPIALSFWTAAIGFVLLLAGWAPLVTSRVSNVSRNGLEISLPQTALAMPVYNEDPLRQFAGLKATYESLEQAGILEHFDLFVLSDTMDPDIWIREEAAFGELRNEVSHPDRLYYRKRRENVERKAGNIADFCATWGDAYRYMVVFDADSVMTGASLMELVRLMEENPGIGILQAPPLPVNRKSLFGRLHQFASHAYGPNFLTGLNFWQGGEGNYWGHNAIIRIQPFIEHCRLPILSGSEPLGGSILSHDFVEAAMIRRAGWKVYVVSELGGSYEELPPSLIGHAARDRRWCQGNLQHARLLFTPGFTFINRLHLWMGVMAYLAPALWLLLLLLATIQGLLLQYQPHRYFPPGPSHFPDWQISIINEALALFTSVMGLLLLPKFFSLITSLRYPERLAAFGGAFKHSLSVVLETAFSVLLAPILAFLQTHFVVMILARKSVKWISPARGEEETGFWEAVRCHWASTALGIGWSVLLLSTVPRLFWWFSPVLAGFVLAIPLSTWTSRVKPGEWTRKHGLFLIPEETQPPRVLIRLEQELSAGVDRPFSRPRDGLDWVRSDPNIRNLHLALLPPANDPKSDLDQHLLQGLVLKLRTKGASSLTRNEKLQILLDPNSVKAISVHKE